MKKLVFILILSFFISSCIPLPEETNVNDRLVIFSLFSNGPQKIVAFVDTTGNLEDTLNYGSVNGAEVKLIYKGDTFNLQYNDSSLSYIYDSIFTFNINDTISMSISYKDYNIADTTIIPPRLHPIIENDTIKWQRNEVELYLIGEIFIDTTSTPPNTLYSTYAKRDTSLPLYYYTFTSDTTIIWIFSPDKNYRDYYFLNILNNSPLEGPDIEEKDYIGTIGSYSRDSVIVIKSKLSSQ